MVKDLVKNLCVSLETDIGGVSGATSRKVVVATPVITLTGNSVTIACATDGATIYYTLDGSTPTSSSTEYSGAITLNASCTVKAIAIKGSKSSAVAEATYTQPVVATPVIEITGLYTATITCATDGATIYYTLDGTTPTTSSTQYTSAISLTDTCTIKAIAVKIGMTDSEVATYSFTSPTLTEWRIVGNSEVQGNEIWSCGEYNAVDSKYHIKVNNGVNVFDIALDEPLRKVNDVADSIEFVNGVATVTRCHYSFLVGNQNWTRLTTGTSGVYRMSTSDFNSISKHATSYNVLTNVIGAIYPSKTGSNLMSLIQGVTIGESGSIILYDSEYNTDAGAFKAARAAVEIIFELDAPTTETIQVPDIAISPTDTYTCEISQGAHAISWSNFVTELN